MTAAAKLLIVESAAQQLIAAAKTSDPYETGGILLGVLSGHTPWITEIVEVAAPRPKVNRYDLPQGITQGLVLAARSSDPRLGYVGDWHSHPAEADPSSRDLTSLGKLPLAAARRSEPAPLLVVVKKTDSGWTFESRRGRWPRQRSPEVLLTGPVTSAGDSASHFRVTGGASERSPPS